MTGSAATVARVPALVAEAVVRAGRGVGRFGTAGLVPGVTGLASPPADPWMARCLWRLIDQGGHDGAGEWGGDRGNRGWAGDAGHGWWHEDAVAEAGTDGNPAGGAILSLWRSFELLRLALSRSQFEELWDTGFTGETISGWRLVLDLEQGFLLPVRDQRLVGVCIAPDRWLPGFDPHVNRLLAARVDLDAYLRAANLYPAYGADEADWRWREEITRDARHDLRWFLEDLGVLVGIIGERAAAEVITGLTVVEIDGQVVVLGGDPTVVIAGGTGQVRTFAASPGAPQGDRVRAALRALGAISPEPRTGALSVA